MAKTNWPLLIYKVQIVLQGLTANKEETFSKINVRILYVETEPLSGAEHF